jgi:hypothetical protein
MLNIVVGGPEHRHIHIPLPDWLYICNGYRAPNSPTVATLSYSEEIKPTGRESDLAGNMSLRKTSTWAIAKD